MSGLDFNIEITDSKGKYNALDKWDNLTDLMGEKYGDITCVCTNIISIIKHWDTVIITTNRVVNYLDFIVLTEMNSSSDESQLFDLQDFNVITKCITEGKDGGMLILL